MYGGKPEDSRAWIDPLIPKITSKLGQGFDEVEYDLSIPGESFFMSSLFFVDIRAKGSAKDDEKNSASVVVKRPPQLDFLRTLLNSDMQFHNEILFYRDYAKEGENFPRCIYTLEKPPTDSVIVLLNETKRGYKLCPYKYDAPREYMLAMMREIGRFHGKGYVMKERHREEFFDFVGNILDQRFDPAYNAQLSQFINLMGPWAVEYLRDHDYDKNFCDKANKLLGNGFEKIMMKVVKPIEPLATVCHGDFTQNNILFKKEEDNIQAMLIDFALIRYGTPVIDLSTLLCMYCTKELKPDRLQVLLKEYHESLTEYLAEHGVEDHEKYSYEAIYDDFKKGCLFGFLIASFFLTSVLGKNFEVQDWSKIEIEESVRQSKELGGEEVGKILADMLLDLKNLGCLDHLL